MPQERKWGLECLHLLDNYLKYEDPAKPAEGEPLANEAWLSATITDYRDASGDSVKLVGKVWRQVCG